MLTPLQAGEHMGQVERVLRRLGNEDIGQGEQDVVFPGAAAHRRPVALVGTERADRRLLFLDDV